MAAPHNLTTINVTAIYMMNKALSDDIDPILYMQGINWLNRTAISYATITLHVKHYKDENGIEHINSDQVLTGGITGTTENRVLDGTLRDHYDYVFGAIVGESTRRKLEDIEDDFLKGTWLSDTQEHGAICSWLRSDTEKSGYSWTSEEVWGFEEIEGERHYARRIKFTEKPGGQVVRARIVYDYGKLK
ncbi:hypothetical protein B0F90DRAFT_1626063 [Multifurca ochricompacta]|uniref:Uncharacterized protein n=1 Tax=Multifurca ochricompacta TaxID=376703 RepID=A0AAD4QNQ9_9AGAM|nr:hypothetical protein B0F90DRAFT_1626063 [Multifurca ochricompacta]